MPKFKQPDQTKSARLSAPGGGAVDYNRCTPVFCLEKLVAGYGISDCTNEEKCSLVDTFWQLSRRTWLQLTLAPKHGSGCEKIASVKVAVPKSITSEVTFLAFRFHGMYPMIGYRDGRTFHIVWLDRSHTVY